MLVYSVTNTINGKVYIGKTVMSDLRAYWNRSHRPLVRSGKGFLLHRAVRKYGENNFSLKEVAQAQNEQELSDLERTYINQYRSNHREFGYNLTTGGEGFTGKHTAATRQKMSLAHTGHPSPRKGARLSDETKSKISVSKKGQSHPQTVETREKLRAAMLGKKNGIGNRGGSHGFAGKSHSRETKTRLSLIIKKQVSEPDRKALLAWASRKGAATRWGLQFDELRPIPCR